MKKIISKEEKHFTDNLTRKAKSAVLLVRKNVEHYAELHAKIYVSSTLGLEDGKEKQNLKDSYIEEFINKVKTFI